MASLSPGKSITGSGGSGVGGQPSPSRPSVEELVIMEVLLYISCDDAISGPVMLRSMIQLVKLRGSTARGISLSAVDQSFKEPASCF